MSHAATALALALANGAAVFITSQSKISRRPRMWLAQRRSPTGKWLSDLVSCPFCSAVWLSLAAVAIYRPLLVHEWWPLDYLVTVLAVTAVAMLPVLVTKAAVH